MQQKTNQIPDRVLGIDISVNHGAFVVLRKGKLDHFRFVTDRSTVAKSSKEYGTYFFPAKLRDWQERAILRVAFWSSWLSSTFQNDELIAATTHAGIEDYAYDAGMNAHQIGEVSGLVRLRVWKSGRAMRLYDPSSIKMFAAHDGTASKSEMIEEVHRRWKDTQMFSRYSKGQFTGVEEDLCDAYAIAQLVWTEVQLRAGAIRLKDLHEREIRVFNRCTKRWPVSLLDRDWIQWQPNQKN
jgi:Holliday junction resolvasome RuvABC endonuclease subunit